ncbi:hypothetical protein BS17DRAFT_174956 [Gyrodon lividus]|nr:hypothetical protein BS17DRAFT_174956 [Gyrodon lividus]
MIPMASPVTDPTTNEPTTSAPPPSLQDRIQTLTDVHNRLQALRHISSMLLKPPSTSPLSPFDPTVEFLEVLRSEKVQDAFRVARASEDADQSELSFRRESRKRKRPQSPVGSPQPYIPPPPRSSLFFSALEDDPPPLRVESLFEFVREFNRRSLPEFKQPVPPELDGPPAPRCKLAIWSRTKTLRNELGVASSSAATGAASKPPAGKLTSPAVIRFMIPDVLTAYISLIFMSLDDPLIVESVTAFGPRERKLPHEHSDYLAFQVLSQHIAKMIQSHPCVPLQILIKFLVSYQGLFVDRCTSCERVLSAEGHIPPVGRVWVPKGNQLPLANATSGKPADNDTPGTLVHSAPGTGDCTDHSSGHWEPRHATCLYN